MGDKNDTFSKTSVRLQKGKQLLTTEKFLT